jgi:transglutaminase-like putative cysteine protease
VKIKVNVVAVLSVPEPMPALFQIEPVLIEGTQKIDRDELFVNPYCALEPFIDLYGNPCRRGLLPEGDTRLEYNAVVDLSEERSMKIQEHPPDPLHMPSEILHYLLPSRYCESDRLAEMTRSEFGNTRGGYARVQTMCDWINEHVLYSYGTSNASTTATDTALDRIGVCRDFAHLGIAFCRSIGIPARYVSGYCLDLKPPDFHAFFQAWLDERWVSFDATEMQSRPALITVSTGRDAADCAWCTFYGTGNTKSLEVNVTSENYSF